MSARLYEFGPFRLYVDERVLRSADAVVQLTPKVFETLLFLIERRGRLVRKDELMEALWPDSYVDQRNLAQNIFLLRKALGDGKQGRRYIQTVPKVGYRFIAEVRALPHAGGPENFDDAHDAGPAPDGGAPDAARAVVGPPATRPAAGDTRPGAARARLRMAKPLAPLAGLALVALCGLSFLLYKRSSESARAPSARGGVRRAATGPKNRESDRYFKTGLYLWNQRTPDAIKKSVAYFQKAIEQEPDDAPAYAALADSYYLIHFYGLDGAADGEAYRKSVEAATAALERDPLLAEAHGAMAMILRLNRDAAETYFRKSIELDPSLATARHRYGQFLVRHGRLDEGLAELRRAHDLAPTSPAVNRALAHILFLSRRYDEVIKLCRVWLDVDANDGAARTQLIMSYIQKGMRAEAEAELRRLEGGQWGRVEALRMWGYMRALSGEHSEALELARGFETETHSWPYYSAYNLAGIYAAMGREEEALGHLGRAAALIAAGPEHQKEDFLGSLLFGPEFDRLRGGRRFKEFISRYGPP